MCENIDKIETCEIRRELNSPKTKMTKTDFAKQILH